MHKQWQIVTSDGQIEDHDDSSSISSDWSFMQWDGSSGGSASPSRETSLHRDADVTHNSERCFNLPNSLDSPIRPDSSRETPEPEANSVNLAAAANISRSERRTRRPHHLYKATNKPGRIEATQATARWNSTKHANSRRSQRNNLNVNTQRAKCIRRGPQVSNGFQRIQKDSFPGGVMMQGRRSTNK